MNLVAYRLGCDEALSARWDFLRNYVLKGEGEIKARLTDQPFWTGHETDTKRLIDDSIDVRLANLDHKGKKVVGSIRFYSAHTYELVLIDGEFLPAHLEFAYRFTAETSSWVKSASCSDGGDRHRMVKTDIRYALGAR